jgi:uncharacterized protein (TIGR02172 family)
MVNKQIHLSQLGNPIAEGRTAKIYAFPEDKVLKLYRPNWPLEWIEYEARIGRIVSEAKLAAPTVGEILHLDNQYGIVFERIKGRLLTECIKRNPLFLRHYASIMAEIHINIHNLRCTELPSQKERLKDKIITASFLPDKYKEIALGWLESLPTDDRICHGDFHSGNIIMSDEGPITIDWIDSTRGTPLADIARTLILIGSGGGKYKGIAKLYFMLLTKLFGNNYLKHYIKQNKISMDELRRWIPVVAAARLSENIIDEQDRLLKIVETGLLS